MSGSLNEVSLIGNIGRDPEIRSTGDGRRIANFSVATSETWRDKNSGERKECTEWHRCVCFNEHLVPVIEQYVRKGSKIFVRGALQTRKWTDDKGVERYSTEVVLRAFNGTLVLLGDAAGGGNRPPPADSVEEYGYERDAPTSSTGTPYSAWHDNPGARDTTTAPEGGDLDEEIPSREHDQQSLDGVGQARRGGPQSRFLHGKRYCAVEIAKDIRDLAADRSNA